MDKMRKSVIILIFILSFIVLSACQNSLETPDDLVPTEETSIDTIEPVYEIDQTGFFRRIDPDYFMFASVIIEGNFNVPTHLTSDEKRALIQLENQKIFDQSMLEKEGHALSYYVSQSTKMITLSYKTRAEFLLDLELLKNIVPYASIEINLHTIDDRFKLSNEITEESINHKVFQFLDYVDDNQSISFTVLDLIEDYQRLDEENSVILPDHQVNNLFVSHYQDYLTYYPNNPFMLNENDFINQTILLISGIKSTQDIILVKAVYVQDQVTVVIEVEAMSNMMPAVAIEYVVAVMVQKNDIADQTILNHLFHTHYKTGFLAQIPFGMR